MGLDAVELEQVAANEADWDARAPLHAASDFYDRPAEFWFAEYEWEDLGELAGREVLHLQCHLGTETIAFARRGARVTGLDLSAQSLTEARRLATEAQVDIEYVHANVYDAVQALQGRTFDVIYTGKGALCYLPDLPKWVDVISRLLKPGGMLYVVEFHPLLNSLRPVSLPGESDELILRNDYLEGRGAIAHESTVTYTGDVVPGRHRSFEWMHGLGELVTSVSAGGLHLDSLRESEVLPWPRWPSMLQTAEGWWRLPEDAPRIPLLFALKATKPDGWAT
ncbi:Methyltransferase type 12 [Kribbella flavida DSM 17836]|uniref:Methyltransferase type 12 n=1 Tax=Kribbella flavida (strain DSM 17836 / JCM 10339 / NBRC 14399) TaxID=479435 RepID=D2Q0T2_KRIFD|nr:class I SAM-dependent methyltransferase [Kribbella flavida]ADB33882.1 Methyltransferase type 12 [Kribbella flavida DSM 17836]